MPTTPVIGCDGIHSRLREFMFRDGPPTAATYSHKYSFRALVPMDQALARLGPTMTATRFMYNGPSAHIITYPVAGGAYLNALAVVSDPAPWTDGDGDNGDGESHSQKQRAGVGTATRADAQRAFVGWHPDVRAVVDLLPERMDKWAIFDMRENPAPRYFHRRRSSSSSSSRLGSAPACLVGDAAHAVGPHLGAGAGFGIEDACLLAELLDAVRRGRRARPDVSLARCLRDAFSVYSDARYERTQWYEVIRLAAV